MGFRTGRVSYARFAVKGGPDRVTADVIGALAGGQIRISNVGAPSEVESGWVAGRHVLDTDFVEEVVVFGDTLLFGLRIDTNRVPAEIRRAYRAMAEEAWRKEAEASSADRAGRRQAREEAEERCREELASGKYRRSGLVPVLWDTRRRLVLAPASGESKRTALEGLFADTFEADLAPRSAGGLAYDLLSARGLSRDYEDLHPSAFTSPPADALDDEGGGNVDVPAVPWSSAGPEPKDFLGNEFLMWLWAAAARGEAVVETSAGPVAIIIERLLETECAWAVTGKQTLRSATPTRWPESTSAFKNGKWPRKAGLLLAADGEQWELTFQADQFAVSSARLPDPEDPPASEREQVELRLASVDALDQTLVRLFEVFLEQRVAGRWPTTRGQISDAIARRRAKPGRAVAELEVHTRGLDAPAGNGAASTLSSEIGV